MSWSPPRKYKGLRTQYVQAVKVTIPYPERPRGVGIYWGYAAANNARLAEMEEWCEENCTRNWSSFGYSTWYFDKASEAVLFKMTFGGR